MPRLGLDLGVILRAGQAETRGDGVARRQWLRRAERPIGEHRPQLRIDAQEVMLGGAVGFRRVVDHVDDEERLVASHGSPPQRPKPRVIIEADATGIAQIGGRAVRLVGGAVSQDPELKPGPFLAHLEQKYRRLGDMEVLREIRAYRAKHGL
jgi:hypothetical protein